MEDCAGAIRNLDFTAEELARIDAISEEKDINLWAKSSRGLTRQDLDVSSWRKMHEVLAESVRRPYFARQKLWHRQQDELVVRGLVQRTAAGIGQVVVDGHHDVGVVYLHHVFDGEEREGEGPGNAACGLEARLALGVGDVHQVDMADPADEAIGVNACGVDQHDPLQHRRGGKQSGIGSPAHFSAGQPFAIVTLDHQGAGVVDEVEIADRGRAFGQCELERGPGPFALGRIKGHRAQEGALGLAILAQKRLFQHAPRRFVPGCSAMPS